MSAERNTENLQLTKAQIRKALVDRPSLLVRKRLAALQVILTGKGMSEAAAVARSTPESVRFWVRRWQVGGLSLLLKDGRNARRHLRLAPVEVAWLRRAIRKQLRVENREWASKRLRGIAAVLAGHTLKEAARLAGARADTISQWVRWLNEGGLTGLLFRRPSSGSNASDLDRNSKAGMRRTIARILSGHPPPDPRTQQRLRAVGLALNGNVESAAAAASVTAATMRRWLRMIAKAGPVALVEKHHPGRPGKMQRSA